MYSATTTAIINRSQVPNSPFVEIDREAISKGLQTLYKIQKLHAHLLIDHRLPGRCPELFIKYKDSQKWSLLDITSYYGHVLGDTEYYGYVEKDRWTIDLLPSSGLSFTFRNISYHLKKIKEISENKQEKCGIQFSDPSTQSATIFNKIEIHAAALRNDSQILLKVEEQNFYLLIDNLHGRSTAFYIYNTFSSGWSEFEVEFRANSSYYFKNKAMWSTEKPDAYYVKVDEKYQLSSCQRIKELTSEEAKELAIELIPIEHS